MSFIKWLRNQRNRKDLVGWIAEDVMSCVDCDCFISDRGEPSEVAAHLRMHYEAQLTALNEAEKEYRGEKD